MTDFKDRLAAARAARPMREVTVLLDGELNAEREQLLEQLKTASTDTRLGSLSEAEEIQAQIDALPVDDADHLTLRFARIPGRNWAELTSRHPIRVDVPIDRHYGYNYDAVCEAASRYRHEKTGEVFAWRLEDGEAISIAEDEWGDLFTVLAGSDIEKIRDAVWALNEYDPEQRLQALVKGSGAATRSDTK